MSRDKNHMRAGIASVQDTDLAEMQRMVKVLPWLRPVLEEIQFLRDFFNQEREAGGRYKELLDSVGAHYDDPEES